MGTVANMVNPLFSPAANYNVGAPVPVQSSTPVPGIERSAGPGMWNALGPAWHPSNPMFWVGGALLVTFGLIAGATEIRVGPAKAGIKVGD